MMPRFSIFVRSTWLCIPGERSTKVIHATSP